MPLKHDNKFNNYRKTQIKAAILDVLYAPVKKKFQKDIDTLIDQNSTLQVGSPRSFRYGGTTYTHSQATPPRDPYANNRLADVLNPRLHEILKDRKELEDHEKPYVENYINQVLSSSNNLPDYMNTLPKFLQPTIQKIIDSCPCRSCSSTEDKINEINDKNAESRSLMGQRMAKNLLF